MRSSSKGRTATPAEVRFTTWTLRYNKMFWVTVDAIRRALDARPRRRESSTAARSRPPTTNVTAMHLTFEAGQAPFDSGVRPVLRIDGTAPHVANRGARPGR